MSAPPVPVLLLTHPGLAEGLLKAAGRIVGEVTGVDVLTNEGLAPDVLDARIVAWLEAHPGPALVLTDITFGSCCQTARRIAARRRDVVVLSGVNAPMLLAAIRAREFADFDAFVLHVLERGREGVERFGGTGGP